jgi:cbb3-type cytochrome oxidase subunit 3
MKGGKHVELEPVNWEPMRDMMNSLATQLGIILFLCGCAYAVVYVVLNLSNLPKRFSHFLAVMAMLIVFYLIFKYEFIPGIVEKGITPI